MVLGYLKYLYFRLFKLYSKQEAKNPYRMTLNAFVLIFAFDIVFLDQMVFYKEKYVNPLFLAITVVIILGIHLFLSVKQRYLKLLEGIEQHQTKRNLIIFRIHMLITILLFLAILIKWFCLIIYKY